jgi:hypothetical protein
MATVNLGLVTLEANQYNPEITYNSNLEVLDILTVLSVLSIGANSPPVSPVNGDSHIIGLSPTGSWSGKANYIAYYYNGWKYITPKVGWSATNSVTKEINIFDGNYWNSVSSYVEIDSKTTNYTLTASDSGKVILINSSSNLSVSLPQTGTEAINKGFYCDIVRLGSGTVSFSSQGSDTIVSKNSYTSIVPQYGSTRVTKIVEGSPNTWHISGDLG